MVADGVIDSSCEGGSARRPVAARTGALAATLAGLLAGQLGWALPAAGVEPNYMADPTYGSVRLEADFMPDPHIVSVVAGGADQVSDLGAACVGYVHAAAPDLDFYYTAGDYRLTIYVRSDADTTLVVNAPNGKWHCNDDAQGRNPLLAFGEPLDGLYSIWVGTYGRATADALLHISERDVGSADGEVADGGMVSTGSGFFVTAAGHLVTNAHVVEGCGAIEVTDHGPARLVLADADADLALLQLTAAATPASGLAVFATGAPRLGADLVLLGYPLASLLEGSLNVTTGVVSGLAGLGRDPRQFQLTAPLQPGNSGGPVLDETGRVIGVAVSKLDDMVTLERSGALPQNINFAIRADTVLGFLKRAGVVARTAADAPALSRTAISERGAAFTAQVTCEP